MKGIDGTDAPLVHVPGWMCGWMDGWMDGWMEVKAVLRIAYSNKKCPSFESFCTSLLQEKLKIS